MSVRPSGRFLGTFSIEGGDGAVDPDWLGTPMFFDNFPPEETRRALDSAGLSTVKDEVITLKEPGHGDVCFLWLLASKSGHATIVE